MRALYGYVVAGFIGAIALAQLALAQSVGPAGPGAGPGAVQGAILSANGHLQFTGAANPPKVNAACGTGATVVGNDVAFIFTAGTSTNSGCAITPAAPYVQRPVCSMDQQSGSLSGFNITASGIINLTGVADGIVYNFICLAQSGG